MELPKYVEKIKLNKRATIEIASPFKTADVAFNWLNRDYPIYHEHSHWELLVIMSGEVCHNINGNGETSAIFTIVKGGNLFANICLYAKI